MVTFKQNAPFGSNVKRFVRPTSHPGLDPSGFFVTRSDGCDPCRYTPISMHKVFEVNKNVVKQPWMYKAELEAWSKNLGYRNQRVLEYRQWRNTLLGPAWHTVPDPTRYEPACKNVGFGRTTRSKPTRNNIPGPGTYYKAVPFKAPYGPHSSRPTFDREEPCRFKDTAPKWSLAPDRYKITDHEAIENKSKKVVSLRGPYDLFTGKRDGSTIKNHFNTSLRCAAATWPNALPGSFETYKKSRLGVMNKTGRNLPYRGRNALVDLVMCLRRAEEPGPAHLNVDKPKVFKQNKRGFNSSYDKPPGYQRVVVWPGVGRYSVKDVSCGILGQGHRHVFISKEGRTIGAVIPQPMNSF
ncbi:uncharacterized protein LOC115445612 [Manduca sexta]|uniref:uncharacterized protein LOC115445612 n=1 Tax=Manduca sexta TaxID=7130 RepID=UPI00188DDCD9|nr:uncharacterized protein LOC115445612 [Manduca sexta]